MAIKLLTQEDERRLVEIFKNGPDTPSGKEALEVLIERHKPMLLKLSGSISRSHGDIGDIHDFYQYAQLGLINALHCFDPSKSMKVGSFIHLKVYNYLLDCVDQHSSIRCPSQKRGMRSYLSGLYDSNPAKKQKFERENNLLDDSSVAEARSKYVLLSPSYFSMDSLIGCDDMTLHDVLRDDSTESSILDKLEIEMVLKKLTPRQRAVAHYWFGDQMTMKEAASKIGIGLSDIRNDIKSIREIFRKSISV